MKTDGEAGSITRADVASFCLDSVKVPDFPYIGKSPCISRYANIELLAVSSVNNAYNRTLPGHIAHTSPF